MIAALGWGIAGIAAGVTGVTAMAFMRRAKALPDQRAADESDARTRLILDVALDAVVVMDSEGRIRDWNPQAEIVFGRTRAQVVGTPLAGYILPGAMREAHAQAMQNADPATAPSILNQRLETVAVRSDGSRFPIEIAITPLPRDNAVEFSAFIRDISDQRAAQAALTASESRYRTAFEQAAVGMAETGTDGCFLRVNGAFAHMLGYMADELEGRHLRDVMHPDDHEADLEAFRQLMGGQRPASHRERRYLRKDGTVAWALANSGLVRDAAGNAKYALSVMQDITDRKRLEEELRQTQKMEAVGRLAGGIAHDFNNLLAGIMGYAELLQHASGIPDGARGDARAIAKTAQQGADLAKNLLTLARRTPARLERVNAQEIVDEVHKLISRTFDRSIDIRTDFATDPLVMNGDRSQLANALLNLALNARDAMPRGGKLAIETKRVHMEADYAERYAGAPLPGPYARITVSDSGTGMSSETQAQIFDPFFTTKAAGRGTGLGLAMVYGSVKSHGGLIQVTSELGRGTSLAIFFPIRDDLAPAEPAETPTLMLGAGRVLLADDEATVREVGSRMLERLGYAVVAVPDGEDAVDLVRQDPGGFDFIVLDGDMERLSGRDAAREIKALAPEAPILLATGNLDADTEENLAALGFVAALSKPYSISELSRVVARYTS